VAFDGDNAGRAGALRVADLLGERVRVANLPDGKDVTDIVVAGANTEDLQILLYSARPALELEVDKIAELPGADRLSALRPLLPKVNALEPILRGHYIDYIRKTLKIRKRDIEATLNALPRNTSENAADHEVPKMSQDHRDEAITLLKDPNLLKRALTDLDELGCVGEEANKLVCLLSMTSRKLDNPICLVVKAESAAGKSFLIESVCQLFPPEEMVILSAMSPKALYHRRDSLAHKIMVVFEREGAEESDYSIRTLQSEKKLIYSTPVKDPESKRYVTEDIEIEGPVCYIESTTRPHLHAENATRAFDVFIDESEEQTKRIFEAQNVAHRGRSVDRQAITGPWRNAQRLLEPLPVVIPWINLLEFPTRPLRVRRDRLRFVALIEASALLHQLQRQRVEIGGRIHIVADLLDYGVAYKLAQDVLAHSLGETSPKLLELIDATRDLLAEKVIDETSAAGAGQFTRREVELKLGWHRRTTEKWLKAATRGGFLDLTAGGPGKAHQYSLGKDPRENPIQLVPPDELKAKIAQQDLNLPQPAQMRGGQVNSLPDRQLNQDDPPAPGDV